MRWNEALGKIKQAKMTNREAAGLVAFARAAYKRYEQKFGLTPFDWYSYALPALGWYKKGDKFAVNNARQSMQYPAAELLWAALDRFASELDSQGQAFEMVTSPVGTDAKFKALANDAWDVMKREGGNEGSSRDPDVARQVDITLEADKTHDIQPTFDKDGNAYIEVTASPKKKAAPAAAASASTSTAPKKRGGAGWMWLLIGLGYAMSKKGR